MRKIIYYTFQIIFLAVIALGSFAIINITDIIKYQTDTESGFPRGDTNYYLYRAMWIGVCIATIVLMIILSYNKDRILKKR
jgi:TRAP-type C4-dicarboxylate transport system permease small subunit